MTKKQIVGEIQEKLKTLGVKKNGCVSIDTLTDVHWVGYKQILLREHIVGALYRNQRIPLYSKGVSLEELLAINKELEDRIVNKC